VPSAGRDNSCHFLRPRDLIHRAEGFGVEANAFASCTSVNYAASGKTALATLCDDESLILTRVPAAAATGGDGRLWLVRILVVAGAIA
jgi:hypothetical protein